MCKNRGYTMKCLGEYRSHKRQKGENGGIQHGLEERISNFKSNCTRVRNQLCQPHVIVCDLKQVAESQSLIFKWERSYISERIVIKVNGMKWKISSTSRKSIHVSSMSKWPLSPDAISLINWKLRFDPTDSPHHQCFLSLNWWGNGNKH